MFPNCERDGLADSSGVREFALFKIRFPLDNLWPSDSFHAPIGMVSTKA